MKPKLDRFIIEKLRLVDNVIEEGRKSVIPKEKFKNWFIGDGKKHLALDYKIRIDAEGRDHSFDELINVSLDYRNDGSEKLKNEALPGFFGNMMTLNEFKNGRKQKKISYCKIIKVELICFSNDLKDAINANLSEFLFLNNFGCRQSKGFGCFFPEKYALNPKDSLVFNLLHGESEFKKVFECIDLLYRCLRSGLNLKNGNQDDKLYFKSLMFQFAKSLTPQEQWDKRTIRHHHFIDHEKYKKRRPGTPNGIFDKRTDPDATVQSTGVKPDDRNFYNFRDLLGLSSEQDWRFYSSKIVKKVTAQIFDERGDEEDYEIERFKSPITFKPLYNIDDKQWKVYILLDNIPPEYLNAKVVVTSDSGKPGQTLTIYPHFNLGEYLKFAIGKFDVRDIVISGKSDEKSILNNIFSQLKKQI
jgi:hypothetical protein